MRKVVINSCYGGFSLSDKGMLRWAELSGRKFDVEKYKFGHGYKDSVTKEPFYDFDIVRDDPALVQVVEELGEEANGGYAKLNIVEIPEDVKWHISEYDGYEHVAEDHRTWY